MAFDIREQLEGPAFGPWLQELLTRFGASPEGRASGAAGHPWAGLVLQQAHEVFDATPATLSAVDFERLLFGLFPRKGSAQPAQAAEIVADLRALFGYLRREFQLEGASACLAVLGAEATLELEKALGSPGLWGMLKNLFRRSEQRQPSGELEVGLNQVMAAGPSASDYQPEESEAPPSRGPPLSAAEREARKKKKKLAKVSRKRNR